MKKPIIKPDRPDLKNMFSNNTTSTGVISKAGVRKKNALTPLDSKGIKSQNKAASGTLAPSRRKRKSLQDVGASEMDFLGSRKTGSHGKAKSANHVRVHIALFVMGLIGSLVCLWAMIYTSHSEELVNNLGMVSVANSLENILSVLAYPVLLFSLILTAYSIQVLYQAYRRANYLDSDQRPRNRS